jgi:hypothetical protein
MTIIDRIRNLIGRSPTSGPSGHSVAPPAIRATADYLASRHGVAVSDLSTGEPISKGSVPWFFGPSERLRELLDRLEESMTASPGAVIAVPDVGATNGRAVGDLLRGRGLNVAFEGAHLTSGLPRTRIAILNRSGPAWVSPPPEFRVVALMPVYNEEDIIVPSVRRLTSEGVYVQVLDNWSTDGSIDLVEGLNDPFVLPVVKHPADGPDRYFNWRGILGAMEELQGRLEADWFILHDTDEIREGPWEGVGLRESLYRVEQAGFNAVDHTVIVFHPVDNDYQAGSDFGEHFRSFEFGDRPGHFLQVKAWMNTGVLVSLAEAGGHEARFDGSRVYPYKFLLRHYPVRSQEHGERKIFRERQERWDPAEREIGWHTQYDHMLQDHSFLKSPNELIPFAGFYETFLLERLTGAGLSGSPLAV